jgi:hypothetical protein
MIQFQKPVRLLKILHLKKRLKKTAFYANSNPIQIEYLQLFNNLFYKIAKTLGTFAYK